MPKPLDPRIVSRRYVQMWTAIVVIGIVAAFTPLWVWLACGNSFDCGTKENPEPTPWAGRMPVDWGVFGTPANSDLSVM